MRTPAIRICNWGRQTGKTTFILNDAFNNAADKTNLVIIVVPDLNMLKNTETKLSGMQAPYSEKRPIVLLDINTFKSISSSVCVQIKRHAHSEAEKMLYKMLRVEAFNRIYMYFDEVDYMDVSYEQLMISIAKWESFTTGLLYGLWLTLTTTAPMVELTSERIAKLVTEKTQNELLSKSELRT